MLRDNESITDQSPDNEQENSKYEVKDIPYDQIVAEMGCRRQNLISLTVKYYDALVLNRIQFSDNLLTSPQELQRLWASAESIAMVVQDGVEKLISEYSISIS